MKNSFLKNKRIKSFLDFFSRVSISAIFISAIPGKINNFERTVEYISSKGIPEPISSILPFRVIMSYLKFGIFYIWRKSKNRFSFFITISYPNNNNFSRIPLSSKSSIYESRINRWINYCCNKGTKINNLIMKPKFFSFFLS